MDVGIIRGILSFSLGGWNLHCTSSGLNIYYLAFSVHIFIHEQMIVQALGLELKQYAYRVLLAISNGCSLEAF